MRAVILFFASLGLSPRQIRAVCRVYRRDRILGLSVADRLILRGRTIYDSVSADLACVQGARVSTLRPGEARIGYATWRLQQRLWKTRRALRRGLKRGAYLCGNQSLRVALYAEHLREIHCLCRSGEKVGVL